VIDFEI